MEIHTKASTLVWRVLGETYWDDENGTQEGTRQGTHTLVMLETMIVEIEAFLNDCPLTYVSSDIQDSEPLTPAHLLYGRKIVTLPYEHIEDDELKDPTFGKESHIKRQAKLQALTLRHF